MNGVVGAGRARRPGQVVARIEEAHTGSGDHVLERRQRKVVTEALVEGRAHGAGDAQVYLRANDRNGLHPLVPPLADRLRVWQSIAEPAGDRAVFLVEFTSQRHR
jgi:hypothetical protein